MNNRTTTLCFSFALVLGFAPAFALADINPSLNRLPTQGMGPQQPYPNRHAPLTPQQRMQEQRAVQKQMEQQMPKQFRPGYEKMMQHQNAIENRQQVIMQENRGHAGVRWATAPTD